MKEATRKNRRVTIHAPVHYIEMERITLDHATNLGPGGVFISTQKPMDVGKKFTFRFELSDLHLEMELRGTVVWAKEGHGMGIRFDEERTEIRHLIETYIDVENEITSAFASLNFIDDESDKPRLFN